MAMEELWMKSMMGVNSPHVSDRSELKPIAESELDKGFQPIADLKPGDKVRVKSKKYNIYKSCEDVKIIIVNRVGKFEDKETYSMVIENDFTALFANDGIIIEFAFDSRRFERVE
jgi:hypothetical protein